MAYSTEAQAAITLLQDRPVAYHPALAEALDSVVAALWLSQILYWDGKGTKHEDGWIEKIAADIYAETGLSQREQETAREVCLKFGVVEYKRMGLPAKPCYRVNYESLLALISADHKSRFGNRACRPEKQEWQETPLKGGAPQGSQVWRKTPPHLQESTSETTSENTTPDSPPAADSIPTSETSSDSLDTAPAAEHNPVTRQQELFGAVQRATGLNSKLHAGRIGKAAKQLNALGATAADVEAVALYWREKAWQAKESNYPTIQHLFDYWDIALKKATPPPVVVKRRVADEPAGFAGIRAFAQKEGLAFPGVAYGNH